MNTDMKTGRMDTRMKLLLLWIFVLLNMAYIVTGGHGLYDVFFASMETAGLLMIIRYALKWPKPEVKAVWQSREGVPS